MPYSEQEIRVYAQKVVDATKKTANYDTGFLYRSIKYSYYRKTGKLEFREAFYGAYNDNSDLVQNAIRMMPKDIDWRVVFEDEEGDEVSIKGQTRTGRTISARSISSENESTKKIKALQQALAIKRKKEDGKKENDTGKTD